MKKRIFALLTATILLIVMACPAFAAAEDVPFNTMVLDIPEVLTAEQVEELDARAWELSHLYECAVYIVITDSLEGLEAWEFSEFMHEEYGMGYGSDQSCVILLLSMEERDYNIMAHGYGNTAFTDYGKEMMAERFLGYFGDDDWYGGFVEYLDCCEEYLQMAYDGEPFDVGSDKNPVVSILIAIAVGVVAAFIVCSIFKSQMKTAVRQRAAAAYVTPQGLVLTGQTDQFINTTRTERYDPPKEDKGGTTVNSSGSSHKSGKF